MSIRARTLLVVVITVGVVATITSLLAGNLASRALRQRENLEVQATLLRTSEAVAMQAEQLRRTSADWSTWDDTYTYAQDQNQEYERSNLETSSLERLDVDLMGFLDRSGQLIRVASSDASPGATQTLPASVEALLVSKPELAKLRASGVIATSRGPLTVAIAPILKSDGSGPSAGTFVIGRYLEKAEARELSQMAGAEVAILATSSAGPLDVAIPISSGSVTGYEQLQGLDGQPGLVLSITQPRTTMVLARQSGVYLFIATLIALLAMIVGLIVSINTVVTKRLERLSADVNAVSQAEDFSRRVIVTGDDEISSLAEDINSMLRALEESHLELEYLAGHDSLTRLYNRRRLEEELGRELMEQARTGGRAALLWLDLDNFKQVNDSLGHAAGDRVLTEFAQELKAETRGYATLARIGGDEFALILPTANRVEAEKTAKRLVQLISNHVFQVDAHNIHIETSIGIALCPEHGTAVDDLLRCADIAMYDAKKSGGKHYAVYHAERS